MSVKQRPVSEAAAEKTSRSFDALEWQCSTPCQLIILLCIFAAFAIELHVIWVSGPIETCGLRVHSSWV